MDIQLKKLEIIQWLTKLSEKSIIDEILVIKSKFSNTDEEYVIHELLELGEGDILNDNVLSHEQVMREMKEKYGINS